jgi:4-amino-4-deoxy-L-arabinose transferase-like glycosyltransferase
VELSIRLEEYEQHASLFAPLFIAFALYTFFVIGAATRPLWHDELYTYYIAKAPTLARFIDEVRNIDLQPPLQYVLSRFSLRLLGDTDFATRAPSMIAFTVASICFYLFVRRRLGRFYALTALLVFWLTPFLQYASEARPYALVVGFLSLAMLGWQMATDGDRRKLGLFATVLGVWGMLLSQAFSPLLVGILCVAELVRALDRRKVDWPVWASLLSPSPFALLYIPTIRRFKGWAALPPEFQASVFKIVNFYAEMLSVVGAVLLIGLIVALFVHKAGERPSEEVVSAKKHEVALVLGLLSLPILINLLLMRHGGAFWPRYCIPTGMGFSLLFVFIMAKLTNGSRAAAAVVAGCVFPTRRYLRARKSYVNIGRSEATSNRIRTSFARTRALSFWARQTTRKTGLFPNFWTMAPSSISSVNCTAVIGTT